MALRIAGLEPEQYTRAGAAHPPCQLALLMREPAAHGCCCCCRTASRTISDRYDGRYGLEDMRQAVTEAKLQGIFPFCLTVDRRRAHLPAGLVFGARQFALLPNPELLPIVLLDWMRRLARHLNQSTGWSSTWAARTRPD